MLAQLDPEAAAAAQAELDAQKQAALDEVNEKVDSQLQSVLAGTAETEGDEAIDITSFLSTEGDGQIIVVQLAEGLTEEQANTAHEEVMAEFDATTEQLQAIDSGIEGYKQSMTLAMDAVIGQVQQDLITGESIGLPIALFIMIIVLRRSLGCWPPPHWCTLDDRARHGRPFGFSLSSPRSTPSSSTSSRSLAWACLLTTASSSCRDIEKKSRSSCPPLATRPTAATFLTGSLPKSKRSSPICATRQSRPRSAQPGVRSSSPRSRLRFPLALYSSWMLKSST